MTLLATAGLMVMAYLLGSVNVAVVLLQLGRLPDPRTQHSGNPGATNVYRVAGPGWAAAVLLLDLARAAGLALAAQTWLDRELVGWVALGLLAGNRWPLFHRFRGGKGVAAFLGFTLPLAPWAAAVAALGWVLCYLPTRLPFVASGIMVLVLGAALLHHGGWTYEAGAPILAGVLLIGWTHRGNIREFLKKRNGG